MPIVLNSLICNSLSGNLSHRIKRVDLVTLPSSILSIVEKTFFVKRWMKCAAIAPIFTVVIQIPSKRSSNSQLSKLISKIRFSRLGIQSGYLVTTFTSPVNKSYSWNRVRHNNTNTPFMGLRLIFGGKSTCLLSLIMDSAQSKHIAGWFFRSTMSWNVIIAFRSLQNMASHLL